MTRPLEGITILDLTWVLAGPFASMILCDLGADVIKVERPPWGDVARTTGPYQNGWSGYFFSVNRGKRSISIDLRKEEGKELFRSLADRVDVVMENFTPGTMDRLGVGYDEIASQIYRFPEVKLCYLISGSYDVLVFIEGHNLKEVANFVSQKLATIDNVTSTTTHFILKKYKEAGVMIGEETPTERLPIVP
jgi:DNA-binding Lrp family transcriptional regulator